MKWHRFQSIKYRGFYAKYDIFRYFLRFLRQSSHQTKKWTSPRRPARRNLLDSDFCSSTKSPEKLQIHDILRHFQFGTYFEALGLSNVNFVCAIVLGLMKPSKSTIWIVETELQTVDWPTFVENPINL